MSETERLNTILKNIQSKIDFKPQIALTLGSGLGNYADGEEIEIAATLDYHDIEGFPVSTVQGHKGRFVFAKIHGIPVVIMQGRVHYYEGYSIKDVVLPTRLMGMMGAKILILTNAAGGVNAGFKSGDFMLITDQISDFVPSPLISENIDSLGVRFPDMSEIYNKKLREVIKDTAKGMDTPLKEGIYLQLTGPNFESPAEVRMCRILGADAVGMSTACEAIAANHMGVKVCGISCISNLCAGMTDQPLSHTEVQETADRVAPIFKKLLTASIVNIANACLAPNE
jgi:purine-nucleoside phosphorylase